MNTITLGNREARCLKTNDSDLLKIGSYTHTIREANCIVEYFTNGSVCYTYIDGELVNTHVHIKENDPAVTQSHTRIN
jgi:hypothetical protein